MRQALWLAFAFLLVLVTVTLLIASYTGTQSLARQQADSLMDSVQRETESRLHRIFDPIRQKVTEDYASIRTGRYSTRNPTALKDRLFSNLFSLHQVDSLMVGDLTGAQFLVMRYTPAVYHSALLAPVARSLPQPPEDHSLQIFTRDFRPAEWGDASHWTLWDATGGTPLQTWEIPLPGYDGRARPWHRAAMARFADIPIDQAHLAGSQLIAWTEVYTLFTTKKPGISASVAARDPKGQILIVAYDLLLAEIAQFTRDARPTPRGQLVILTEDGRLLGPPQDARADADARATAAIMQPVTRTDYPLAARISSCWAGEHNSAASQFRVSFGGESWWAGFRPFEIGDGRQLWIAVLLPETDLVPAAKANERLILVVGAVALLAAGLLAFWMARRIATPLTTLATQARHIAELQLDPAPRVRSAIAELALLSETLHETRASLREGLLAREQATHALADSERQMRTITENTLDLIVRIDRQYRYVFANAAHEQATGIPSASIRGRKIDEVGHPPSFAERLSQAIEGVFTSRTPTYSIEFTYPTRSGPRHFEARIIHEAADDPAHDTILGVCHDVTERIQATAELARSRARYRSLVDSALVGIIVHQDGIVRFANPAAFHIAGQENTGEVIDRAQWSNYVDPAFRDDLVARGAAALRGEPVTMHPGWPLLRPDGSLRWVQSTVTAIDWDGKPALLSFIRDNTELRAAHEHKAALEDQLRHAQKLEAVGLLAGGIAHDFNNLLQIIAGNAQLASIEGLTPAEQRESLAAIVQSVQRAAQMTRQLLAFSRRQALARENTDLNTFVADYVRMIRRVIPETIRIDFTPAQQPLVVHADRGQLEQVLLNLCLNARDAMPAGGLLSIRLGSCRLPPAQAGKLGRDPVVDLAEIRVVDTGHGMDESTRARIFDPFFTTKSRDKGTGLGLAVVYGIIRQHDGLIEVASQPGNGATFTIRLPLHAGAVAPAATATPAAPPAASAATILLAEDNGPIRQVAQITLRRAGYTVLSAGDGQEAVELFERDPAAVDLLFFDAMMPRLGGFDAANRCRALRPDIPVLFASGYAAGALADGENVPSGEQILPKPYDTGKLLSLIATLLGSRRN